MKDLIPVLTRSVLVEAVRAAFAKPECVGRGGLHAEAHIGHKQAAEMFNHPDHVKWPVRYAGQPIYLIDSPNHFEVVAAGSFKKLNTRK